MRETAQNLASCLEGNHMPDGAWYFPGGDVLLFVPAVVDTRHLQDAIDYLRAQMVVRDMADQGGT